MAQKTLSNRQQKLLAIFESQRKPLTAQEAWNLAGQDSMGLATVYRAINRLVELDLIHRLEIIDAEPMWEAASIGHHHHFFCTECHRIFKIGRCVPKLETLVPPGFHMKTHTITLYGECRNCAH